MARPGPIPDTAAAHACDPGGQPPPPPETAVFDELRVLHVDPAWIVVDKPAGLPSVPGRAPGLADCVASRIQARWPDARIVHRLDMATSGLLLLARGADTQRRLGDAFAHRRVEKVYEAVVAGCPADNAGEIDLPLAADWPRRPLQCVDVLRGRPSVTRWRVLARDGDRTQLQLEPLTGRTHQLRVHLAASGWPILGDTLYAPPALASASPRLLLHACRLALAHPIDGDTRTFASATPF